MTDLRDLIAETLAGHWEWGTFDEPDRFVRCECGATLATEAELVAAKQPEPQLAYRRHVADVILAALGERVLPDGGETREEWQRFGGATPCADWERDRCANEPEVHKRRSVTSWPDGSTLTGPWRPVDTEEAPA